MMSCKSQDDVSYLYLICEYRTAVAQQLRFRAKLKYLFSVHTMEHSSLFIISFVYSLHTLPLLYFFLSFSLFIHSLRLYKRRFRSLFHCCSFTSGYWVFWSLQRTAVWLMLHSLYFSPPWWHGVPWFTGKLVSSLIFWLNRLCSNLRIWGKSSWLLIQSNEFNDCSSFRLNWSSEP